MASTLVAGEDRREAEQLGTSLAAFVHGLASRHASASVAVTPLSAHGRALAMGGFTTLKHVTLSLACVSTLRHSPSSHLKDACSFLTGADLFKWLL